MFELDRIGKDFSDFELYIEKMKVQKGDYVVVLGDSGSGKSLLLELIAGLVKPDSGTMSMNGENLLRKSIQERPIGLVFQDPTLFPHLSVEKNLSYPLTSVSKLEAKELVHDMASQLSINKLLNRPIIDLSGGEKQRVSLGRTLITQPQLLLLDEPLSALDTQLKKEIRALLRWLNRQGQTILHVTHDYEEAISLASKIGVMDQGKLIQFGPAEEVLKNPRTSFVANFTGIQNYFKVELKHVPENNETLAVLENGISIQMSTEKKSGSGYVIIPCESLVLSKDRVETSAANHFLGEIKEITKARFGVEVSISSSPPLVAQVTENAIDKLQLSEGQNIWVSFKASSVKFVKK